MTAVTATLSPRVHALQLLLGVTGQHRSLDALPPPATPMKIADQALARALAYGVLRHYFLLQALTASLLTKPLKQRDLDLQLLIMMGLFQLQQHRAPDYAVVSQTVATVAQLDKAWARGLVNAVLRRYLRERTALDMHAVAGLEARHQAPRWLINQLQQDWPDQWQAILSANNRQAPMVLRVNLQRIARDEFLQQLRRGDIAAEGDAQLPAAVRLHSAVDVEDLPGFAQGWFSVQDTAAQWAAILLNVQAGERVLDACAAPGGKTLHLLETQPALAELHALEIDATRAQRIDDNVRRLLPDARQLQVHIADAADTARWWDGRPYDAVLLDAPCSATGVIRRHPDIQLLRRAADIETLARQQLRLLQNLWQTVAPGGRLLYCTCSVLRAENAAVIGRFLEDEVSAEPVDADLPDSLPCHPGVALLPGAADSDGFYYAMLRKRQG